MTVLIGIPINSYPFTMHERSGFMKRLIKRLIIVAYWSFFMMHVDLFFSICGYARIERLCVSIFVLQKRVNMQWMMVFIFVSQKRKSQN